MRVRRAVPAKETAVATQVRSPMASFRKSQDPKATKIGPVETRKTELEMEVW
jgi:hypothetical protein